MTPDMFICMGGSGGGGCIDRDGVGFVEGGICRYVTSGFEVCRVRGYGLVGTMYDILYYYMLRTAKPNNAINPHCMYTLNQGIPHPQFANKTIVVFV